MRLRLRTAAWLSAAVVLGACASLDGLIAGNGGPGIADAGARDGATPDSDAFVPGDAAVPDCGPEKSACLAAECPADKCLSPTHVKDFGLWSRAAGIRDVALIGGGAFDTKTGAAGTWRSANTNPAEYEVQNGIGFVRKEQGPLEPTLAIWVFSDLKISGGTITFTGDASVVIASARDLTVEADALLDVGAKRSVPGPGGFAGGGYAKSGLGCAPGQGTTNGGGGGGFGTDGASAELADSGAGGLAASCDGNAALAVLRGGSGGGGGDDNDAGLAIPFGGAGGGALQLSALGHLVVKGRLSAGGGGGRTPNGNNYRSGAGGGSGGAIFLEAPAIAIAQTAGMYANGGGGGMFGKTNGCTTTYAQDGLASLTPAMGDTCGGLSGGAGAAGSSPATSSVIGFGGGGGGGGLGRILLKTLPGSVPDVRSTELSPGSSPAFRVVVTLGE